MQNTTELNLKLSGIEFILIDMPTGKEQEILNRWTLRVPERVKEIIKSYDLKGHTLKLAYEPSGTDRFKYAVRNGVITPLYRF